MLPVTISLGLINFNLAINSIFGPSSGTFPVSGEPLSEAGPAAIDKAFRIYMLPQGMFSVAVATVVFPTLARFAARREYGDLRATMANGMRMILLVLSRRRRRSSSSPSRWSQLVYQRGDFTAGRHRARRRRRSSGSPSRCRSTASS